MKTRVSITFVALIVGLGMLPTTARAATAEGAAYQSSYDFEARGAYAEAVAALMTVPTAARSKYTYALRLGWLNYLAGRHGEAIAAYRRAIAAAPKAVEPRLGLTLPQMAQRRWLDVERTARDVQRLDPHSYLGLSRQAFALYNLGRFAAAEAVYTRVVALYPSDVEMRAGLAWAMLERGDTAAAATQFRDILAVAPKHASAQAGARACAGVGMPLAGSR